MPHSILASLAIIVAVYLGLIALFASLGSSRTYRRPSFFGNPDLGGIIIWILMLCCIPFAFL